MKIAVLGASGRTGRLIVDDARRRGDEVVSVVRRPDSAPASTTSTAVADGRDAVAIQAALTGCDAVAFAIGPSAGTTDHTVMRESLAATLAAMSAVGLRRIVMVGAEGPWGGSGDPLTRFVAKPILNRVLAGAMGDLTESELLVRASDTDWTVIRPAQLTDGAATRYRRRIDKSLWFGFQTTRAGVAAAVIDALHDPSTIGHSYSVSR